MPDMPGVQNHLKKTMLSGAFAAIPIAITIAIILYVENMTRAPLAAAGLNVPGLGIVFAVLLIYMTGLFVTSLVGRFFLTRLDRLLHRLPLLRDLYKAWKQISFTPGGGEGIYAKVVLVPDGRGDQHVLAFSSLDPIGTTSDTVAVFVPNAPNPVTGRVAFIHRKDVIELPISTEEAFKILLSSGNYVPAEVAQRL
jgi:uncharacterized membrane protein